jgi:predicted dithiol-disulfide oxidoreductase (DUF899 family)
LIENHEVVSHEGWIAARTELLAKEKEFTRLRDELTRQQRALPWELVSAEYVFEGADGRQTLAELFDGCSQLLVYHFMFAPEDDEGCPHCSFWADNFDPVIVHMNARDTSMVAVSKAALAKLQAYRRRMGWSFHWVSSFANDFNHDFGVSFTPEERDEPVYNYGTLSPRNPEREGVSVFFRDEDGRIFHTYSAYARGIDLLNTAYNYIDLVPRGRDEDGRSQYWVRRHDEYGT